MKINQTFILKSTIGILAIALALTLGYFKSPSLDEKSKTATTDSSQSPSLQSAEEVESERRRSEDSDRVLLMALSTEIMMIATSFYNIGSNGWITEGNKAHYSEIKEKSREFSQRIGQFQDTDGLAESKSLTVDMIICLQDMVSLHENVVDNYFRDREKIEFASKTLQIQKTHQRLMLVLQ